MPDRRSHRGPHPEDARLFAPENHQRLRQATADLCWLISRGYAADSALKLVGDRYNLVARQRTAIGRAACTRQEAERRKAHRVDPDGQRGSTLWLDGYNVLTTIEAALARGVILACCDGTYRDMASMHGSFRRMAETLPALEMIGRALEELGAAECLWLLDRPVSNSGRLAGLIARVATEHGWPWRVALVPDPDPMLSDPSAGWPEWPERREWAVQVRPARGEEAESGEKAGAGKTSRKKLARNSGTPEACGPGQVRDVRCGTEAGLAQGRWLLGVGTQVSSPAVGTQVIVATADSAILDHCPAWLNLARLIVSRYIAEVAVLDLAAAVEWR